MTPFGLKLKSLRKEKKVSITELAKALKISTAYLSMLENGKRWNPPDGMVELICAYFGLIWDDAQELKDSAKISDINVQINTKNQGINATTLTNVLKNNSRRFSKKAMEYVLVCPMGDLKNDFGNHELLWSSDWPLDPIRESIHMPLEVVFGRWSS